MADLISIQLFVPGSIFMAQVTLLPILLKSPYEPGFKENISKVVSIAIKNSRNDACNVVLKYLAVGHMISIRLPVPKIF